MGQAELHAQRHQAGAGPGQRQIPQKISAGQDHLWQPGNSPVARRMLFVMVLHLDACWGRTGCNRCSMKPVDTKVMVHFSSLPYLYWQAGVRYDRHCCDLGKERGRNI